MKKRGNPYPKAITDECSGIQVLNIEHKIWAEGYEAGRKDERVNTAKLVNKEVS